LPIFSFNESKINIVFVEKTRNITMANFSR